MSKRPDPKIATLRRVSFLQGCPDAQLAHIARVATEVRVASGDVLAREGRPGHSFYVVVEGRASVTLKGDALATLGPGDFFGEMSILESQPRAATVTAETPLVAYEIHMADFHSMLRDAPEAAVGMLRALSRRLRIAESAPSYRSTVA